MKIISNQEEMVQEFENLVNLFDENCELEIKHTFEEKDDKITEQFIIQSGEKQKSHSFTYQLNEKGFYILAENIQDPGNLGTMIRTADACHADAVFLSKGCVDLYNTKVLRSTMGSLFHLPIFQNVDFIDYMDSMKQKNIMIFAAHLKAQKYYYNTDFRKCCALLIGNEGKGITDKIAQKCHEFVKIPMVGKAESLNASVAAGVLMYEVVRQRMTQI